MKTLVANQKCLVFTLLTVLILSIGIQNVSYGQANTRTVRLFYFLPNDRSYRQEVVDAMKTGILEVQSFYADQMEAHGHGNMTFRIETDAQGVPIVHRVNGDYFNSHYKDRDRPENEISREFDISSIVQLVVMDISRSSGGRGTGVKQRGQAIIDGRWDWRTAAHELGHAFGLQHDFRDDSYIMSYGSGRSSLSAGAAKYLAVNPYINHSIPLQAGAAPSVQLLSSSQYSYGTTSVPVTVRVRDPDGLQQVTLFVKTPEGINLPTGYNEVVSYHNLSGQTDATVTFNYKGGLPSEGDDDTSLLDQLRHTIYVSAVDKQGNRIDAPPAWTLQPINIKQAKVPVSTRSPRVRDSIYNGVRLFHDRSVSAYDHITDAHLAKIGALLVNNIELLSSPLQYGDFDGLTNLSRLELRLGSGFSESSLMPAGIFEGLTSLNSLKFLYYTNIYGDDPSLYPLIPFAVGLKKVGEGQFKAIVPTGAPFNMDLPLIVVNGSINGGAESVTIPAGSVESDILTVTRTPGTTAAVIVDLERTVPSPPGSGYVFYKSSYHLEMFSPLPGAPTPVAERTPQVLDAIVAAVPEINHIHHDRDLRYMVNGKFVDKKYNMGHYVSEAHLAAITSLNAPGSSEIDLSLGGNWFSLHGDITELKPGDFDGLTNLTTLRLDGNDLSSFPENIFDNLTNLTALNLADNQLSLLPAGLFDNLTDLTTLSLGGNALSSLPAGIFDQLTNLTTLTLYSNQLSSLPAGLFDNLTNLTLLNLLDNPLTQLPEGYFDNLTNLTTLHLPPTITPPPFPEAGEVTPVADRTPQVRDAIVAAAGVNSAADVTEAHLAAITADLQVENISVLKQGDFDNLINLDTLGLIGTFSSLPDGIFDNLINLDTLALVSTQLSSLPEGICDNLINLTYLAIANTPLSSLPGSLFDNLTKVSSIFLSNTQLSSLPDGIFDNLTNMPYILLSNNQLSSLPSGIFDKATMIVDLSNNQLSSLPDGIFKGIFDEAPDLTGTEIFGVPLGPISEDQLAELGDYTTVNLTGNLVDPLPLTVSLERVANGQFKAVAPAGAPFNLVLPIRVANGSINDGAESITIPVGSVESDTFTVTRTPGTTFSVSVDIETLPGLPQNHTGYTLVKSVYLPLVFSEFGGILSASERTPEVRDAIVRAAGVNSAADVTEAHLAAITSFEVSLGSSVKVGDFDGLTGVIELGLSTRQLTSLPAGLFNDLSNVTIMEWIDEKLITLPVDAFQGFTNLTSMTLYMPQLASLPDGIFDSLTNLTEFELVMSQLTSLPDGIFDQLTNLTGLGFHAGQLTSLPDSIFDQLTNLTDLGFHTGQVTSLPDGIFDQLTNLTGLSLSGSHLTNLLDSIKWPTTLTSLGLYSTQLSTLPDGVFAGLPSLTTLNLNNNNLTSLPPDIFSELPNLTTLLMRDNQLSTLPDGLFSGLSSLTTLRLSGNSVDPMPLTVSLEKVADGQFKAVAPAGAPFEIVLPLSVTDGSISGGATSLTIPAGSVESGTLTVTRTSGATLAASADIGTLPSRPANHFGYSLVKSTDLPITVIEGDIADESVLTLTVGAGPGAALRGYNQHSAPEWDFGSFSPQSFELNGVSYTMYKLTYSVAGKRLALQTIPHLPGGFALHLDAQQFTSVTALDYNQYTWNNVELDWSDGKTVQIGFITTPPMPPGPPTNLQATPGYEKVTLSWIPPANADSIALPITEYEYRISVDGGNTWDPDWETIGLGRTGHNTLTSCTFGDRNNNRNVDNLIDINLANGTSYTFEIRARGGDGYSEAARITVVPDGSTPISERTPQVRDAIVAAVAGVNSAADVTEAHLAAITSVFLLRDNITTLKAGDFDGLTALTSLDLSENQLSTLPEGIFDGLAKLRTLQLHNNQLSTLPQDIFDGLTKLRELQLHNNQLSTLSADVFEGLSGLDELFLQGNQLTTLPAGIFDKQTVLRTLNLEGNQLSSLPEGIFDKLTELNYLTLADNQLTTLPAGIFDGPSALYDILLDGNRFTTLPMGIFKMKASFLTLRKLYLEDNAVDPLPLTVSLEKVADGQFKAVAPAGATFDFVLQISVANGTINGGTTTLTIPKGSVESDTLSVTRTAGTTTAVTVDIGTLPQLPTSHQGYELVKSADLPLEVISPSATEVVTQRTDVNIPDANLRAKIESALGKTSGATISATEIATLTTLTAQDARITNLTGLETATNLTTLKLGNNTISNISALTGLTSLTELQLWDNQISNLSDLSGLTNLTTLYLWGNSISDISHLAGLTSLTRLRLGENSISNIAAVSRLTNLTQLHLNENGITDISAVAGLTNLTELRIGDNTISDITPVQNLTNLEWLDMPNNSISDISAVQNLTQLVELYFQNNAVSDLSPLVANTGLRTDDELDVRGNLLSYPSIYTHIPALQARNAYVDFDNRVATAPVKISGDTQQENTGVTLTHPFVVEVQDGSSVAFAGVPVTFAVTAGSGTLSATNTTTDVNGRAETTLTLGNTAGTNTVSVSVTGITQTIIFTATATTAPIVTVSPIINRTSQVRDAIVAALPGINSANDVTDAHLATITHLDLENKNILTLKDGDFDELSALTELRLQQNRLTTLPANIFSGLSALKTLYLNNNQLASLPTTVFSGLSSLSNLYMNNNKLTSLPETVFSGLTSLRQINMHTNQLTILPVNVFSGLSSLNQISVNNNRLTSLPENVFSGQTGLIYLYLDGNRLTSLPANLFSGLAALEQLKFNNNRLSTLPAGLFRGLSSLTWLLVQGNTVTPLPFTVSLEKVGTNQFKATAPVGAPFTMTIPITVVKGSISGGATTLTIPAGDVESAPLTVTRTLGTTGAVTVDIGNPLPGLPTQHQGYELVKSANLPLTVINAPGNSAPVFTDSTSTTRSIAENTISGVNIGSAVSATDVDNDTLTYSLSGTDAAAFSIVNTTGQLQTRAALDYETKSIYTVTITVSDGSLTRTITVNINITDIDELPTSTAICEVGDILAPGESCTYPGTDTEFSVLGNGNGQFLFFTSGSSLSIKETEINGESYTLVAKKLGSGSWEIEEIGDSGDQQTVTREQPGDTGGTPTITASTAAPLTEATLHEGIVTLNLSDGTFERSIFNIRDAITLTGIIGVTVDTFGVDRLSDTQVTAELAFDGNMTANSTLTISLGADAIEDYDGTALTSQMSVSAITESVTASTASPLTEATLDESVVTLTLSGRKYERLNPTIRDAVSVSGIAGVTVRDIDIDRESDTEVSVELTFDGDITTDGTLTFTVGADAIAGYNGPAFTVQVSVSASTETPVVTDGQTPVTPQQPDNTGGTPTLSVSTAAPLTEATLHESVVTLTLSGATYNTSEYYVSQNVEVSGITGVTFRQHDVDRVSDTKVTVELEFNGDFDTDGTLTFTVGADALANYNGPALTAQISVSAVTESVTASTAAPLTEATLDESVVTLTLSGRKYERLNPTIRDAVSVSGIAGITVRDIDIDRESDTEVSVELTFDGDITTDGTLTFTVGADAIAGYNGPAFTVQVSVSASTETPVVTDGQTPVTPQQPDNTGGTPTLSVSTAAPLTEATLHESVVTLTLSGATYNTSEYYVSQNVEVSGITGVTFRQHNVDRVSDTKVTVELEFNGDFDTDGTLTFTVGADALANYNGPALTAQISVSAVTESVTASTAAPLTEATLDESVVTLTLSGRKYERLNPTIRDAVSVSGIAGITVRDIDIDRESDTEVSVELTFDGDITTDGTLTFTVGADAIAGYNGPAFTAQVSVSAGTETPVVTDGQTPVTPQQPGDKDPPEQPDNNTGGTPTLSVTTAAPLTEATLHEGVITLNLSGGTFERSSFTIKDAITLTGITGVTVDTFGVDRLSDTQVTVKLAFAGNMTTDSTLTISVGAGAIKDYNGAALTWQISVRAVTESMAASTASQLTEATLDESIVTLTLNGAKYARSIFDIRDAVTVSTGIAGVTVGSFGVRRVSDTKVTVELEFDGTDFDSASTLTFTVEADAIAGYNGPAFTAQISVTANTEFVVASTASPLTEATLDESVVTLTLSGRTFERSSFKIRDAVTVSGIAGVTVGTFDIDRVSDTQITVELTFDGNINADSTLTFTVGADAIVNYSGSALTAQVTVTADRENALLVNFPNPFNPETWIPYQLPQRSLSQSML